MIASLSIVMQLLTINRLYCNSLLVVISITLFKPVPTLTQLVISPCTDVAATQWVRDPYHCNVYYICAFGQPQAMPPCPALQVWSNSARNCVPENSRWNDCRLTSFDVDFKDEFNSKENYTAPGYLKISLGKNMKNLDHDFWKNLIISVDTVEPVQKVTKINTKAPLHNKKADSLWKSTTQPLLVTEHHRTQDRDHIHFNSTIEITERHLVTTDKNAKPLSTLRPPNTLEISSDKTTPNIDIADLLVFEDLTLPPGHPCREQFTGLHSHPKMCHWYFNCTRPVPANLYNEFQRDRDSLGKRADIDHVYASSYISWYNASLYSNKAFHSLASKAADPRWDNTFMVLQPSPLDNIGPLTWECRYPQLFDQVSGRCREFLNVDCHSRFEPVDQCEYTSRQCPGDVVDCTPCEQRLGTCRGFEDGVYPLQGSSSWGSVFITCYLQRNIARDECLPPVPVFSPQKLDCVSLFEVPKEHGGFQPDCKYRPDSYYPDEQGRCAIFFRCALGHFRGYDECPPGSVFDPVRISCETFSEAARPCGEGLTPVCRGRKDGLYADLYGRCIHYFQCSGEVFQHYFTCDLGVFDPLSQQCVVAAELTVRPCGLQPSPCEALPTGMYPDQVTGCTHFIECYNGILLTNSSCEPGSVFSALTGRCDHPRYAPPPCGTSDVCLGRPDGRYPASDRGCSFYFECQHGQFTSLRRCTGSLGGYFFDPVTGKCDYPQNICPPCGFRWWGCPRLYHL